MGSVESAASPEVTAGFDTPETFFSTAHLEEIKIESHNEDILKDYGKPTADIILLSSIIESILASQRNTGEKYIPKNLENFFYDPVIQESNIHIERAKTYYFFYDRMTNQISKQIDDTEAKKNAEFSENAKNFVSLNKYRTTSTRFLETILSSSFEVIFNDLEILSPDEVSQFLDQSIALLDKDNKHNIIGISSPVIDSLNRFSISLGKYKKFQTLQIQFKIVHFLFKLGLTQKNVCGCLSALIYLLSLPDSSKSAILPDFNFDNNGDIKSDFDSGEKFKFSEIRIETSHERTFWSLTQNMIKDLIKISSSHIEGIINGTIQKSTAGFSFFVDSNTVAMSLSMELVDIALNESFDESFKSGLITLGLNILCLNIFKYCLAFARPEKNVEENDSELFDGIKNLIERCIFSESSKQNPVILESSIAIISLSFRYLYFPNYCDLSNLIDKTLEDEILNQYFMKVSSIFLERPPLLYIFSEIFTKNLQNFESEIVFNFYCSALDQLATELLFIENNNAKENENCLSKLVNSAMIQTSILLDTEFENGLRMLKHIVHAICTIEEFPLIADAFIRGSENIVNKLVPVCRKNAAATKADQSFLKVLPQEFSIKRRMVNIETPHNYPDNYTREWLLDFTGASSIHFVFDPKCHTESNNDSLTIYDSLNGGNVIKSLSGNSNQWPETLDIPFSKARVVFQSDATINYWGVKCEASALIPKQEKAPIIEPTLFFLNFLFHTIGRLMLVKLRSLEMVKQEADHKGVFEHRFLRSEDSVLDDRHRKFLDQIIGGNNIKFIEYMGNKVKCLHKIKMLPELIASENSFICAVLAQLEMIDEAIDFEERLQNGEEPEPSPLFKSLWRALYKLRLDAFQSNQKTLKRRGEPKSLKEDFQMFTKEIQIKAHFLTNKEPLTKRYSDKMDKVQIEQAFEEIRAFVTSDFKLSEIKEITQIRMKRLNLRRSTIDDLSNIITQPDFFGSSEISMLLPIHQSLSIVSNTTDIQSVPDSELQKLSKSFVSLFEKMIQLITTSKSPYLHLILLQIMSISTGDLIPADNMANFVSMLMDFVSVVNSKGPIQDIVANRCAWKLICIWSLKNPTQTVVSKLLSLAKNNENEHGQYNSLLILSLLTEMKRISPPAPQAVVERMTGHAPRVVVASVMWLEQIIIKTADEGFPVTMMERQFTFKEFIEQVLHGIGSALADGSCDFLTDSSISASHRIVARELIAFIRLCMRPLSKGRKVLTEVLHSIFESFENFSDISRDRICILSAIFAVLGSNIGSFGRLGYCTYVGGKTEPQICKVISYDVVTRNVRLSVSSGIDHEVIITDENNVIPACRISSNPLDFELTEKEIIIMTKFYSIAESFIKENPKEILSEMESTIINFFSFLSIILQVPNNADVFINNFPVQKLLELSTNTVHESFAHSIGHLMNKVIQLSRTCGSLKRAGMAEPEDPILPSSLVFDHLSSYNMIPLRFGSVNNGVVKSTLKDQCIFTGDILMPPSVLFYYEITIKTISNTGFILGLVEGSSTTEEPSIYGFDFKRCLPVAKFLGEHTPTENVKVKAGDTIGCGYTRDSILFYVNGAALKSSIPVPSMDNFAPIIVTNKCPMSFTYNFGLTPFVSDVISSPLFDIKSDCLYKVDVTIPSQQCPAPKNNSLEELDSFIREGNALWEIPLLYTNEKPGTYHSVTTAQAVSSEIYTEYTMTQKQQPLTAKFFLGQPVIISRRSLNQSQAMSRSFIMPSADVEVKMNRYGVVTEIAHDKLASEIDVLTVEFYDPEVNKVSTIKVDCRFADPMECSFNDIIKCYGSRRRLTSESTDEMRFMVHRMLMEQRCGAIRSLVYKLARCASLAVLDRLRVVQKIDSTLFAVFTSILRVSIIEIAKFVPEVRVNTKWEMVAPSDYFFIETAETNVDDVMYKVPGDLKRFNWFLRAFFMSEGVRKSEFMEYLLKECMDRLKSQNLSTNADLFEKIHPRMQVETWHPMPLTSIHITIKRPKGFIGVIPIVHPLMEIGEKPAMAAKCELLNASSDTQLITDDKFEVTFEGRESKDLYGLKFGFFCVPQRISADFIDTPLGAVHCLMYLLSLIFSYNQIPESLVKFAKHTIFTGVTTNVGSGNVIAEVFTSSVIAPILTLKWYREDLTPAVQSAFDGFAAKFENSITEWGVLSVHAQKALLLKVFTKSLVLDTMAASIGENADPSEIAALYDSYIKAKSITKETIIFQQMVHAFSIICALGFGQLIPVRFPAFLIAEAWAESFEHITSLKVTTNKQTHTFASMKSADIRLAEESKLPPDCLIAVDTFNRETVFLAPGESFLATPTFTTRVVSKSGHELYEGDEDFFYLLTVRTTPLTHEAKRKVFVENYALFKQHVNFMAKNWQIIYDETLRRILKTSPSLFTMVPLVIPDTVLASNAIIALIPTQLLRCRIYLFKCLDECIMDVVKVVEFGNRDTLLGDILNACRAAVATQFKMSTLESVVLHDIGDPPPMLHYRFNRFKAALFRARPTNPNGESILSQFVRQTPLEKLPALKREIVPWRVDLVGEGATDLGGPGRDVFTEACMEIMHPSVGLFIQTPNKSDRTALIPNPAPLTAEKRRLFFYAGVLMTICYTSRLPEPFKFARFVWNYLTERPVTIDDIYEIDFEFKQFITSIENTSATSNAEFQRLFSLAFTVQSTLGEEVELIDGGSSIPVTFERRFEYTRRCKKFRMKEFNEQLRALRAGFNVFFPTTAVSVLAPWELELVICGDNTCPIEEMKRNCNFPANDRHSDMLWEALETFTPEERMLFIKFGCGRMGLPPPGTRWTTPLQIQFKLSEVPDDKKPLPTAMTCNSSMVIPRYSSLAVMIRKLKTAITFGADIQQDHAANFNDVATIT